MIRNNCENCGRFYWGCKSRIGKYCSQSCSYEGRRKGEERDCEICGDSFYTAPSHDKKYCSPECYYIAENKQIEKECLECGNSFKTKRSKKDQKFCKRECFFKYVERKEIRKNGEYFCCDNCGTRFYRQPNQIKKGVRWCSNKCRKMGKMVGCFNDKCDNKTYVPDYKLGMHKNYYCSRKCMDRDKTLYPNTIEYRRIIRQRRFYEKNYFQINFGIDRDSVPQKLVELKRLNLKRKRVIRDHGT